MKGILGLLKAKTRGGKAVEEGGGDSVFFTTAFAGQGVDDAMLVPWEARAVEVGAKRMAASRGGKLLQALWSKDKYMAHLDKDAVERMERFFEFAAVAPNRDVIRQDEYGNFMVVLLTGLRSPSIASSPGANTCAWRKPAPAISWVKCRCWTAVSAFRPAPRSPTARSPFSARRPWTT